MPSAPTTLAVIAVIAAIAVPRLMSRLESSPNQASAAAAPQTAAAPADPRSCVPGEAYTLYAGSNGHFAATVELNGKLTSMMVDTGASFVSISSEEAKRVGLDLSGGRRVQTQTANGVAAATLVSARNFRLGPICLDNIDVLVSAPGALGQGLLGMNVIKRLSRFDMNNTRLVMAR